MTRLCVLGPSGRMGAMVIERQPFAADLELVSCVDRHDSEAIGRAFGPGSVIATSDLSAALSAAEVYIDFSTPRGTEAAARVAREHATAAVIGTTGLDPSSEEAIDALAERAPVVVAANFSLGVNLLIALAETASRALPGYDLEVVELHHRRKLDAPSGTAIALAQGLARGRGLDYERHKRYQREGADAGPRPYDEIGVVAVRGGDIIGEHTAFLVGESERIELTHRAASRSLFADGALRAASWVVGKQPGRYGMKDVLGL